MNLLSIKNIVTSKAARQLLIVQKHSPVLMFGAGVVGVIGTVVLASKATLKVEEILVQHQGDLKAIKTLEHVDYTEEDRTKDKALLYTQTAMKLTKLYAPAVVVGVISIGCLTGSHIVLTRRNAGLTAAYAALEKGFKDYRRRVTEEFGAEKDREFRYGFEDRVEENEKGEKVVVRTADFSEGPSIYAKLWDESNINSNANKDYDLMFLRAQQNYANHRLQANGHLFLNEVYDSLGLERTRAGQVVGWVKDNGDNYVDFGIFNRDMQPHDLEFFTGREDAIWLDFNVDGVVLDLI